jgi:fermentation-respiration switch protein FrsA (DUF1100 family)
MKRLLAGVAILAVAAYAGGMLWLVSNETRLVFENRRTLGELRPAEPFDEITSAGEGTEPHARAWLMPSTAAPSTTWVVFLHGNSATIASRMNIHHYERLRALGLNVMAPEYRGYGGLGGEPTEAGLAEDARQAYETLRRQKHVTPDRIVIYGWSLGSAVAVTLASQVDEAALVLEGAPASIVDIGAQRYPFFPIRWLIRNPFESIARIARVGSPLLVLHSPEDTIIPIAEGRRLFEAAAPPKQFVEVAGGHVNASETDPRFFAAVGDFLRAHRLLP